MIPTTADAYAAAAEAFGIPVRKLYGPHTSAPIARVRFAAWLIAYDLLCRSYPEIGAHAGRDHSTIQNGCARARALLDTDPDFAAAYTQAHDATNYVAASIPVFRSRRAA